ncbi:hypothetical protein FRC12_009437 [Ceratobasidium sp. 428]|nr:hypothetical protein FRC12_009437 [Ceratobasidium sp. 428]
MSHRSTTPHKIFGVPELLGIICKYSECLRSPHLLQISRAFFLAGVPLVWQEVVGVQNLLKLLPGVSFNATGEARIQGTVVVSSDLENVTRFARFDLYAQFVKYLKLFSPDISSYIVTGWRHLSELTKRRVLLPNLLELSVTASYPLGFIKNPFLWIRMFLSPSLTSIVVEGPGTVIEEGWEIGIILSISHNCSELTKLHLEFDDNTDFMPNLPSFRPLGVLPLAEVCLKGEICVRNNELDDLATIWPNVTRFEMWDLEEDLRLQGLRNFVKLPRVQHLALPVSWHHGIPLSITPAEPSYTLRTFEILNIGLRADFDVSLLAQYLLSLWPNLESALSNMVASQRNFNRLKSRIIDQCGLNVLDALLR